MKTVFLWVSALTSLLTLAGCSGGKVAPPMPENAPMGWQLKSIDSMGKKSDCSQIWRAEYTGGGIAHVDVCQTVSDASGLNLQQKWRARANTVTFFNKKYFVAVNWDEGEKPAITALVTKLEKSLDSK
jgi:predicted small lipoprotein YifL